MDWYQLTKEQGKSFSKYWNTRKYKGHSFNSRILLDGDINDVRDMISIWMPHWVTENRDDKINEVVK